MSKFVNKVKKKRNNFFFIGLEFEMFFNLGCNVLSELQLTVRGLAIVRDKFDERFNLVRT